MCGICGIYYIKTNQQNDKQIQKMVNSLHHRGPDDFDIFNNNNIFLGSNRLSIFDLTKKGKMPMVDNNLVIVHNGEIYNYLEIKDEFDFSTISNTDTEIIVKSYNKLGINCLDKFNGIFSFAIYNKNTNEIFCARDRLGIKPFFYYKDENTIIFSSEIKGILAAGIKAEPNYKIITQYLKYGIYDHSNETFFKNIYQLPAAHYMIINENGIEIKRYWDIKEIKNNLSLEQTINKFKELLTNSINLQLRSDVPVSLNISGGIDSTLISYMIDKINNGQKNIKARTYIFNEDNDERASSKELINSLKWDSEYTVLKPEDIPIMIDELIWSQEQPFPGIVTFAKHKLISSIQNKDEKVIIEGQGGDEIAAGYQYIFGSFIHDLLKKNKLNEVENEIFHFSKLNNLSLEKTQLKVDSGIKALDSFGWSADCTNFLKHNCFNKYFIEKYDVYPEFIYNNTESSLLKFQYRDIFYTKLPRILRSCDRASMFFSKELRVPLLDHNLVEFCYNIPSKLKINNGEQRYFYRRAFKDLVPNKILHRPKDAVVDPQTKWFANDLKNWILTIFSSESFKSRIFFNSEQILLEYNKFINNKNRNNSFFIWQCICMEFWFRKFID